MDELVASMVARLDEELHELWQERAATYIDSITIAAQHAQDWDLPTELLPLVITSHAALLSGHEAGHMGHAAWD